MNFSNFYTFQNFLVVAYSAHLPNSATDSFYWPHLCALAISASIFATSSSIFSAALTIITQMHQPHCLAWYCINGGKIISCVAIEPKRPTTATQRWMHFSWLKSCKISTQKQNARQKANTHTHGLGRMYCRLWPSVCNMRANSWAGSHNPMPTISHLLYCTPTLQRNVLWRI